MERKRQLGERTDVLDERELALQVLDEFVVRRHEFTFFPFGQGNVEAIVGSHSHA